MQQTAIACSEEKAAPPNLAMPARWRAPFVFAAGLLAGLVVFWGLLFLVIPPWEQNFPLNDDWAFARGAFQFARGEGINYSGWSSMPQLGQWLWACPFVWLFG